MESNNNLVLLEKRESKNLDLENNSNVKLESLSKFLFEFIENAQDKARINREKESDLIGQEYWVGFVGGLGYMRQQLEKELSV